MANSIPNIKVGKSVREKQVLDLSFDNSTTAHWGFVQPLMCREMIPNETLEVQANSFVRLAPMVRPTMARVSYNMFHQFVPMSSIWEPFESFLAEQPYASQSGNVYIPNSVPNISVGILSRYLIGCWSECTVYEINGYDNDNNEHRWDYDDLTPLSTVQFNTMHTAGVLPHNNTTSSLNFKPTYVAGNFAVTFDGADYTMVFSYNSKQYLACYKLLRAGRNLRQVMIGCGIQPNMRANSYYVSVLPLVAYYKVWFDIFEIQRNLTWKDTYAARVMMQSQSGNIVSVINIPNFANFLEDLATKTYYTESPNSVSIAQQTVNLEQSSMNLNFVDYGGAALSWQKPADANLPYIDATNAIGQTRLDILEKLTKMINKNNVIGGRIADYLSAHYGAHYMDAHETNYIGSDSINVQISDVMNSTDAGSMALGDYAGQGTGSGSGSQKKFTASTFGYWFTLGCIVPKGNYNQGQDRNATHISRYDFYTSEFDAVGYQTMRKGEVIGEVTDDTVESYGLGSNTVTTFGLVPRYSEYKTKQNVLNGDMSLRSMKDDMLPYTLDKNIAIARGHKINDTDGFVTYFDPQNLVASTAWRYVGREPWLGNYDRIFDNSGDEEFRAFSDNIPDNFIIHNVFEVKAITPMLSMSSSYEDFDRSDNGTIEVEKV